MSSVRIEIATIVAAGVTLIACAGSACGQDEDFSDATVERAIARGVQNLWSLYDEEEGHWPEEGSPAHPGGGASYYGGHTSLAVLALLSAGESSQDPRMKRALDFLRKTPMNATYCLGLRAQVWAMLPENEARAMLARDAKQLVNSISRPAGRTAPASNELAGYGTYTYLSDGKSQSGGDHSNTQFGILGAWAAVARGGEIPPSYWDLVYAHWLACQNPDGGWGYHPGADTTGTMTAAGLASMFVAYDNLTASRDVRCGVRKDVPAIQKALDWFDRNFDPQGGGYYLYGVERVGLASGYKYFGSKDWYKLAAAHAIATQRSDGGWGGIRETPFVLLFLVRGRNPVIVNRLEYDGDWNNRPRALANFARWASRTFEREVNWQIISFKVPVEEWHDAPILLITGSRRPNLSDGDMAKLLEFVHQGGMILSVAEGGSQGVAFDEAMRGQGGVYARLLPQYEPQLLRPDHPILDLHFQVRRPMRMWGISNGVRLLALHTTEDLPLVWQSNCHCTAAAYFQTGANIAFFVNDHALGRPRGTSLWPRPAPSATERSVRVVRVRYGGNWDPEPLAWERFRLLMAQNWRTDVVVEAGRSCEELDVNLWPVAVITGTNRLSLSDTEKAALKDYVVRGGTVVIDAAGGARSFAESVRQLTDELFGEDSLEPLRSFSPVYALAGMKIEAVRYRQAASALAGPSHRPRLEAVHVGGRPAVIFSREDLTSGLMGYPSCTAVGYRPDSAIALMRNIVLYGAGGAGAATDTAMAPGR